MQLNSNSETKCRADFDLVSGLSSAQLCQALRHEENWVTDAWVKELLEHGVLELDCAGGTLYSGTQLEKARTSAMLQRELSINPPGIALALQLLDTIVKLETRVTDLKILLAWSADSDTVRYYH